MRSQNSSIFPANFLQSMFLSVTCYWLIDWLVFNVQRAIFQLYSGRVTCYDFPIKTMFGSSLPPVVCWRAHVLFTLFVFVCVKWCPAHIVLYYCFVFLHIVYPVLPVSLDCTFLIAPSVFSNVYFNRVTALLCIFTFWIPSCDVRYDFRKKTMFGSSLPPVVCKRDHILFTSILFACA